MRGGVHDIRLLEMKAVKYQSILDFDPKKDTPGMKPGINKGDCEMIWKGEGYFASSEGASSCVLFLSSLVSGVTSF